MAAMNRTFAPLAFAAAMIAAASTTAQAQAVPAWKSHFEFNLPGGAFLPLGAQRDAFKRGTVSAAQLAYVAHPMVAVTATFGWARSRGLAVANTPKLDVFMYDIGAEGRLPGIASIGRVTFTPIAALGAGARSYNYRADVATSHKFAMYCGLGGEAGLGIVHLRIEARDYVTNPGTNDRNDAVVLAGIRLGR
jgi:hypothetical protein